jgi:hypothetical protein
MLQETPALLESFDTLAVKASVCPSSIAVWEEGVSVTEIEGLIGVLLPPQPNKKRKPDKTKRNFFMTRVPPRTLGIGISAFCSRRRNLARK